MSTKKVIAIILFVLQALGVVGALITGSMVGANIFNIIGFFIWSIIGIILLYLDNKSNTNNQLSNNAPNNYSSVKAENENIKNNPLYWQGVFEEVDKSISYSKTLWEPVFNKLNCEPSIYSDKSKYDDMRYDMASYYNEFITKNSISVYDNPDKMKTLSDTMLSISFYHTFELQLLLKNIDKEIAVKSISTIIYIGDDTMFDYSSYDAYRNSFAKMINILNQKFNINNENHTIDSFDNYQNIHKNTNEASIIEAVYDNEYSDLNLNDDQNKTSDWVKWIIQILILFTFVIIIIIGSYI